MQLTIHPTARVCEVHVKQGVPAVPMRVWEGVTDRGTPVQLLVARVAPLHAEPVPEAIQQEFEASLANVSPPLSVLEPFPLRMII